MKTVANKVITALVIAFVALMGAATVEAWQHLDADDPRSSRIRDEIMTVSSECADDTLCSTTLGDSKRRGGGGAAVIYMYILAGGLALGLAAAIIVGVFWAIVGVGIALARLMSFLIASFIRSSGIVVGLTIIIMGLWWLNAPLWVLWPTSSILASVFGLIAMGLIIRMVRSIQSQDHPNLLHTSPPASCNEQLETKEQFQPNDRVRHPDFGDGTLLDIGMSRTITYVDFDTENRSRHPVITTDLQML